MNDERPNRFVLGPLPAGARSMTAVFLLQAGASVVCCGTFFGSVAMFEWRLMTLVTVLGGGMLLVGVLLPPRRKLPDGTYEEEEDDPNTGW